MIKLTAKFLFLAAMLCSLVAFGCGGGSQPVDNKAPNNTAKNDAPKNDAPKSDAPKESASTGDKIGVAECDEYLEKLEACLTSAPEASRQMVKDGLERNRKSWKDLAANPQTKPSLQSACKTALDSAKQTYSYCKW